MIKTTVKLSPTLAAQSMLSGFDNLKFRRANNYQGDGGTLSPSLISKGASVVDALPPAPSSPAAVVQPFSAQDLESPAKLGVRSVDPAAAGTRPLPERSDVVVIGECGA